METSELLKRVRQIEIRTKGLSNNIFAGQYHSAFKGKGMSFSEVREYQYGDDIRDIDWNVTARSSRPHIKVFEEERELTVMLLVDVSASGHFGTRRQFKREMITEVAATIAFSAIQNNDKVGLLFFSDRVEKFIPPQKGKRHILYLIRELIEFEPQSKATAIAPALAFMTNAIKKRSTAFLITDFMTEESLQDALTITNRKHDLMAIQIYDHRDTELPNVGIVKMLDPETQRAEWVNTSSSSLRSAYAEWWNNRREAIVGALDKSRVNYTSVATDEDYVKALMLLFSSRR